MSQKKILKIPGNYSLMYGGSNTAQKNDIRLHFLGIFTIKKK